ITIVVQPNVPTCGQSMLMQMSASYGTVSPPTMTWLPYSTQAQSFVFTNPGTAPSYGVTTITFSLPSIPTPGCPAFATPSTIAITWWPTCNAGCTNCASACSPQYLSPGDSTTVVVTLNSLPTCLDR